MGKRITDEDARARMIARGVRPDADVPYPGGHGRWPGTCLGCDGRVVSVYNKVVNGGQNYCRVCSNSGIVIGQPIPDEVARARMIERGIEPDFDVPFPGSGKPWSGTCLRCANKVAPRYNKVVNAGQGGCKPCGIKARATTQRNDDIEARKDMRERGGVEPDPNCPYPGANHKWPGTCLTCGTHVAPKLGDVGRGKGGCLACGIVKRSLTHWIPDEIARAQMIECGIQPDADVPYPGGQHRWPGTCLSCGGRTISSYSAVVTTGRGGCNSCADYSFDRKAPALVYLVIRGNVIKIGVTNNGKVRFAEHRRFGWVILQTWQTMTGKEAERVERTVIDSWRDAGIPYGSTASDMPQAGYTETAPLTMVDLDETSFFIESLLTLEMVS